MMTTPFMCPLCRRTGLKLGVPGEICMYHDRSLGYDLYNVLMTCDCGAGCYTSMAIWSKADNGKVPVAIQFDEYDQSTQVIFAPVGDVKEAAR